MAIAVSVTGGMMLGFVDTEIRRPKRVDDGAHPTGVALTLSAVGSFEGANAATGSGERGEMYAGGRTKVRDAFRIEIAFRRVCSNSSQRG